MSAPSRKVMAVVLVALSMAFTLWGLATLRWLSLNDVADNIYGRFGVKKVGRYPLNRHLLPIWYCWKITHTYLCYDNSIH
jgi:hypothetical protein